MKIKLTCHSHKPGCEGVMGTVIEVTKENAQWMCDQKAAQPADHASRRLWGYDEPETAMVGAPENAATRTERAKAK